METLLGIVVFGVIVSVVTSLLLAKLRAAFAITGKRALWLAVAGVVLAPAALSAVCTVLQGWRFYAVGLGVSATAYLVLRSRRGPAAPTRTGPLERMPHDAAVVRHRRGE